MEQGDHQLFPGMLLRARSGPFYHSVGGEHSIHGAWCPNCKKPLVKYMTLDLSDPRLRVPITTPRIHLLYCMRCALSWHPFVYTVNAENDVSIVRAFRGDVDSLEWYQEFGDFLPWVPVELVAMPPNLPSVIERLDKGIEDDEDRWAYNQSTGRKPASAINATNQVGGRPFRIQKVSDPKCICGGDARFLASMYNDEAQGILVEPRDWAAQIFFFCCELCGAITAIHRI